MQAKDITDDEMLATIRAVRGRHGVEHWSSWFDVRDAMSTYPAKVLLAKLRSMIKRKVISGCACGCRGDFEVLW